MASDNLAVADWEDGPVLIAPEPQWHERYNCNYDDRVVVFQVEDVLFKVHPHMLVGHSQSFRSNVEEHLAKSKKDTPIKLEGISSTQFEYLLDFYHRGMHLDYDPPLTVWISLLKLATRFEFPHLRTRAIREIESDSPSAELDPIDKIVLARDCDIEGWLVPCYEALCHRPQGLKDEEAARIGVKTASRVWRAREALRKQYGQPEWSPPGIVWDIRSYDKQAVSRIVHEIFGLTFESPVPTVVAASSSLLERKKKKKVKR